MEMPLYWTVWDQEIGNRKSCQNKSQAVLTFFNLEVYVPPQREKTTVPCVGGIFFFNTQICCNIHNVALSYISAKRTYYICNMYYIGSLPIPKNKMSGVDCHLYNCTSLEVFFTQIVTVWIKRVKYLTNTTSPRILSGQNLTSIFNNSVSIMIDSNKEQFCTLSIKL